MEIKQILKEDVNFEYIKKLIQESGLESPWYFIMDRYFVKVANQETIQAEDITKELLDIRIFSPEGEIRLWRNNYIQDFKCRIVVDDSEMAIEQYLDEEQSLDIDANRSERLKGQYITTGGGRYTVPFKDVNPKKIKIRNYLDYYTTGQVYIKDYRIISIGEGGEINV